jgi:broad specificity phosphatase PhoE
VNAAIRLRASTAILLACLAAALPAAATQVRGVERVIAFADVHGAHSELVTLLRESGVIDAAGKWSAGRTHVVSLGDLLDRGADSRQVMDLLMRLQEEARATGGGLHVVLGNHEAMNVLGDLRDVHPGEYAAYADHEVADERAQRREAWLAARGPETGAEFDRRFPPGYFGHRRALGPEGRYGRWLLSQPVAVVLNETLFLHAGPSPVLRGLSLEQLNQRYRNALDEYLRLLGELQRAGLVDPDGPFHSRPQVAGERLAAQVPAGGAPSAELAELVRRFTAADDDPLLNREGPNWYRGAALCHEASEADVLDPLLRQFGVTRLVVGHTPTRNQRALTRFDGRVVKLDAGMNTAVYRGRGAALLLEGTRSTVRYSGEPGPVALEPEPLHVAPTAIDDASVQAALREGRVRVTGQRDPNLVEVTVEHQGRSVPAVFLAGETQAVRRELAAHALDRHLRLGIVPATVAREVDGRRGVLQARPPQWVSQGDVQRQALRGGGWCALEPQFELMYAFDALIGNEARTPETLLFDAKEWYVYVTGHDRAFGTGRAWPAYLKERPPQPGAELRRRLATLDAKGLEAVLGEWVEPRARRALLERRDALLALPPAAERGGG